MTGKYRRITGVRESLPKSLICTIPGMDYTGLHR